MPPDFFHPHFYLVTASFSSDQHAVISQLFKSVDVEQSQAWEVCAAEGDRLEPWLGVLGWLQRGFFVLQGFLMGTWRLSSSCPLSFSSGSSWTRLGWELSQHIQEKQRVYLAPSSDLKGIVKLVWKKKKKPQLDELNPSGLLVLQKRVPELTQAMFGRAREKFWLRNYLSAYCSHECFMKPLIPSDFPAWRTLIMVLGNSAARKFFFRCILCPFPFCQRIKREDC